MEKKHNKAFLTAGVIILIAIIAIFGHQQFWNESKKPIVGVWRENYLGNTEIYVFKNGGSWRWSRNGTKDSGTWKLEGDILTFSAGSSLNKDESFQYKIAFENNHEIMHWYKKSTSTDNWATTPRRTFVRVAWLDYSPS